MRRPAAHIRGAGRDGTALGTRHPRPCDPHRRGAEPRSRPCRHHTGGGARRGHGGFMARARRRPDPPPVSRSRRVSRRRAGAARLPKSYAGRVDGCRKIGGGPRGKRTGAGQETDEFEWSAFLEVALGVIGWSPRVFWQATPHEFWAAFAGWRRAHGVDRDRAAGARVSPQQMRATAASAPASIRSIRKLAGGRVRGRRP